MSFTLISENKMFGGWHKRYSHFSESNQCDMTFAIYLPPQAASQKVPVLYWLSGLTCTDENFSHKAGAQRIAAKLGLALVMPDTSPRGDQVPDDKDDAYYFGKGAGFYLNATQEPWDKNYNMYDYVVNELPKLVESEFNVSDKKSISGHSMGGHGALTIGLKNADQYQSVSAFSPVVNPIDCPWGQNALSQYIGDDQSAWGDFDTCALLQSLKAGDIVLPTLIDQGLADNFLDEQLKLPNLTKVLEDKVSEGNALPFEIREQKGYDHSYFFVASFIEEHLRFHATQLSV